MKNKKTWLTILGYLSFLLIFTAPSFGDHPATIPVVSEDGEGKSLAEEISSEEYSDELKAMVSTVNDSMTEALVTQDTIASWKLTTVMVGVGISAEVGIGPIVRVRAVPRFRLAFSKNDDPVLP